MIPYQILKKIKKLEITTRHIVKGTFSGEYHSVFKGRGMSFSEVREYHPGDDVRLIDWNVTARTGTPHIKVFEEERELTVVLMVDISASENFGSQTKTKAEIVAEIAAILGFSANLNNDRVGLLLFSDQVEKYIPPKKGKDYMLRILRDIFYWEPQSQKTSIQTALDYFLKVMKKRAIVFLISDFLDVNYDRQAQMVAKKHDLIPIIIQDEREQSIPRSGILLLEDNETQERIYINSSSLDVRHRFRNIVMSRNNEVDRFFKSLDITPIRITSENYVNQLRHYFKTRSKRY